jgi:flagellar secretion chaperone FliS
MIPPEYVRRYAATQITSAGRGRLLLLVLEGGQAFLARARVSLERGDVPAFVADLARMQEVLLELAQTLDHDRGGDIAGRLARLYEFMIGHLARANAERSLTLLDDVSRTYEPIVDAYRRIVAGEGAAA